MIPDLTPEQTVVIVLITLFVLICAVGFISSLIYVFKNDRRQ